MADLVNNFSWSISRADTFSYCKRKYYLNYYDYWGGWNWDADERTKLIYFLKNGDIEAMQFSLNGNAIFAIPDLCYRNKDGRIVLVDWKSGKSSDREMTEQLMTYALRLAEVDHIYPDMHEVFAYTYYLPDNVKRGRQITTEDLNTIRSFAEENIGTMKDLLDDVPTNRPMGASSFPKTQHENKCRTCVYLEVCEKTD